MEENKIGEILKLILGDEVYTQLITDTVREYNNTKLRINEVEPIIESYFIAILLIGFSKKQVNIDNYTIHLINKSNIKIDTNEFCKKYENYINTVENFKLDLLRQLL